MHANQASYRRALYKSDHTTAHLVPRTKPRLEPVPAEPATGARRTPPPPRITSRLSLASLDEAMRAAVIRTLERSGINPAEYP